MLLRAVPTGSRPVAVPLSDPDTHGVSCGSLSNPAIVQFIVERDVDMYLTSYGGGCLGERVCWPWVEADGFWVFGLGTAGARRLRRLCV